MAQRLAGRIVAITGAGRGIGAATARALVADGARVAIGDIDLETAEKTAADIGGEVIALSVDVTDPVSFDAFLDEVESRLGPLDVMINNAGIMPLAAVLDTTDEVTARVLDINVKAMIRGTKVAAERMLPRGNGHVVNVASTAGWAGIAGGSVYSASKAAMIAYSQAAEVELSPKGINVSCVMPGIVRTELATGVKDLPGFHAVTPEQVADGIVDAIASPRFEVFVPKSAGPLLKFTSVFPRRAGLWLGRKLGADTVFLEAAADPTRAAYEKRAKGDDS